MGAAFITIEQSGIGQGVGPGKGAHMRTALRLFASQLNPPWSRLLDIDAADDNHQIQFHVIRQRVI